MQSASVPFHGLDTCLGVITHDENGTKFLFVNDISLDMHENLARCTIKMVTKERLMRYFPICQEREKLADELKAKEEQLMCGNPLLNNPASFSVKKRWDDDVVFKNQTRGETKTPKRFINDTIRSDFHRKFLQKYMK
ncbi:hypothetical protein OROGR_007198 [Orobanche gracilis]